MKTLKVLGLTYILKSELSDLNKQSNESLILSAALLTRRNNSKLQVCMQFPNNKAHDSVKYLAKLSKAGLYYIEIMNKMFLHLDALTIVYPLFNYTSKEVKYLHTRHEAFVL